MKRRNELTKGGPAATCLDDDRASCSSSSQEETVMGHGKRSVKRKRFTSDEESGSEEVGLSPGMPGLYSSTFQIFLLVTVITMETLIDFCRPTGSYAAAS